MLSDVVGDTILTFPAHGIRHRKAGFGKPQQKILQAGGCTINSIWSLDRTRNILRFIEPQVWVDNHDLLRTNNAINTQYLVEAIRCTLCTRNEHGFWHPYFTRLESLVAKEIAYRASTPFIDPKKVDCYRDMANRIIIEAIESYARHLGVRAVQHKRYVVFEMYAVLLVTTSGKGAIYLLPATEFRMRIALGEAPMFRTYASGQQTGLTGLYYYYVEENGRRTRMNTVRIDNAGTWRFVSP